MRARRQILTEDAQQAVLGFSRLIARFTAPFVLTRGRAEAGTGVSGMMLRPLVVNKYALVAEESIAMVWAVTAVARPVVVAAASGPSSVGTAVRVVAPVVASTISI